MNRARPPTVNTATPLDTAARLQPRGSGSALGPRGSAAQTDSVAAARSRPPEAPPTAAQPASSAAVRQPATGRLTISGLPAQGTAFVDDQWRAGTSFTLPAGTHVISLVAPGYERTSYTVEVKPGESVNLRFPATRLGPTPPKVGEPTQTAPPQTAAPPKPGILVVRTLGGWARIYVDNVLRREGSSHRDTLAAGNHNLRLEREGFVTIDTTVTVRAGELELVTLTMKPREP